MSQPWEYEETYIIDQYATTNKSCYALWWELKAAGFDRTFKAVQKKLEVLGLRKPKRFINGREKVFAYWDIECSDLTADFGIMLSWALKLRDGEVVSDNITLIDIQSGVEDKRILESLISTCKDLKIDTLIDYYGTGFDRKFVKTRCMFHGIYWYAWGQMKYIDIYYKVRTNMKLHRKSLDSVTRFLEIKGKTHLDATTWRNAARGDEKALSYVVHHNIEDVKILERVHKKIERYSRPLTMRG